MTPPEKRLGDASGHYYLWFGFTALTLGALTLLLVLVVLPRRYVLHSGLRESGVNFPTTETPFTPSTEPRRPPAEIAPAPTESGTDSTSDRESRPERGPAQIMWDDVDRLLAADRPIAASAVFEAYLRRFPDDHDARRAYALTLRRAGRSARAVSVMEELLAERPDPELRRTLARSLRDLGRVEEASARYAELARRSPGDLEIALEWARSFSWNREYAEAEAVLQAALDRNPAEPVLQAELAQVYYEWGRLQAAADVLAELDEAELDDVFARSLRDDVMAALAPPADSAESVTVEPSSPVERARRALTDGAYEEAAELYREALDGDPTHTDVWVEYADVLQYRLEDLSAARSALLEVESRGGAEFDRSLRYRIAQLDAWTGRTEEAARRLAGLLEEPPPGIDDPSASPDRAEVRAFLGDVRRWDGERLAAVSAYERSLADDPANERARVGLETLREQVADGVRAAERPRLEADAYSIQDSDDYARVDLVAEAVRRQGSWFLRTRTGSRWLQGRDLLGASDDLHGFLVELESARWWRWGTLRTAVEMGWENVRPGDAALAFGGSLRMVGLGGVDADLAYHHGPAYPLTSTLQSALGRVTQDRLTAVVRRALDPRWTLTLALDAARLDADSEEVGEEVGTVSGTSTRLEAAATVVRELTPSFQLGLDARAMRFTDPAPRIDGRGLFWDPDRVASAGLVARWEQALSDRWGWTASLRPGLAHLAERRTDGTELVPHLSAEASLLHTGERFRTELGAFYLQSRFDGYRSYGLRLSVGATTGHAPGEGR